MELGSGTAELLALKGGTGRIVLHQALVQLISDTGVKGGIGTQSKDVIVAEYPSKAGQIHAVTFNQNTGKFAAGCFEDPAATSPEVYTMKETEQSGAAFHADADRPSG